jgi:hypothetical protein
VTKKVVGVFVRVFVRPSLENGGNENTSLLTVQCVDSHHELPAVTNVEHV